MLYLISRYILLFSPWFIIIIIGKDNLFFFSFLCFPVCDINLINSIKTIFVGRGENKYELVYLFILSNKRFKCEIIKILINVMLIIRETNTFDFIIKYSSYILLARSHLFRQLVGTSLPLEKTFPLKAWFGYGSAIEEII